MNKHKNIDCRRLFVAGLCMLLFLALPKSGLCNSPVRWFGTDGRTGAMGGAGVAVGRGPGNLYINPALMSFSKGGAWLTFSAAANGLQITPKKRDSAFDVPEIIYDANPSAWPKDRPIPTNLITQRRAEQDDLDPTFMLNFAAIDSFFHEDLMLGLSFTAPLPSLVSYDSWYNDEREQYFSNNLHFERFGEFDSVMSISPGASFAPFEWLSVGFAMPIDLVLTMDAKLFLTEGTEWEYSYINTGSKIVPTVRPIVGLAFKTPIGFRFGAVYRHQTYADINVDVDLRVWHGDFENPDTGEMQRHFYQSHRFILGYKPREISLAAAYEKGSITLEAGGTWEQWSGYLDHHGNNFSHPTWDDEDDTETAGWDNDWKDPEFKDVFNFRGGAEWRLMRFLTVRGGFGYFPSPMPTQTGRYNYVDNDLFLYSLGVGFRFPVLGRTVTADIAGQLWHMKSMEVVKSNFVKEKGGIVDEVPDDLEDFEGNPIEMPQEIQSNNPGLPGYKFGGVVFNTMIMIGMEFD